MAAATRHRWKGPFQSRQLPCFLLPFPFSARLGTPSLYYLCNPLQQAKILGHLSHLSHHLPHSIFGRPSEERTPHPEIGFASRTCRFPPLVIPNLHVHYGLRCFEVEIATMNDCNVSVDLLTNLNYISFLMKMESRQQEAMVSLPGYIQILGWGDRYQQLGLQMKKREGYRKREVPDEKRNVQVCSWLLKMRMAHGMDAHFEEVQVCPVPAFLMQLCFLSHKLEFQAKNEQKYLALKNRLCEMRLESELLLKLKRTVTFNEELKAKHVIVFAVMMPVSQD
ncbi:unnamed protein product [Linum tenue]|uniref:Uncharacterized protein n=1 Tax=Linum tenue TaxID=586396 RepID=A0AAV0NE16_9ROSI|nr:unnamed protein product [Linum tenue]